MAEFEKVIDNATETIQDAPKKAVKWVKKNKVFAIACGGAVVLGLIALNKRKTETDSDTVAYVPTGYEGYPTMSESAMEYGTYMSGGGTMSDNTFYDEVISGVTDILNQSQVENNTAYESIVNTYEKQNLQYNETLSYLEEQRRKDAVIAQMSNNSNLWGLADTDEERQALYESNQQLGASIGATFDSKSGTWWLNGERLFFTNNELASGNLITTVNVDNDIDRNVLPTNTGDTTKVSYDKNVDYASLINQAKAQGASQQVIDQLTAQRNAKIKGENLNEDGTPKTTSKSGGGTVSSGSKSSGTTTTVTPQNASKSPYAVYTPNGTLNYSATKQAELKAKGIIK